MYHQTKMKFLVSHHKKMEVNTHLHEQRGDKRKIEVDVNDNRKCVKRQLTLDPRDEERDEGKDEEKVNDGGERDSGMYGVQFNRELIKEIKRKNVIIYPEEIGTSDGDDETYNPNLIHLLEQRQISVRCNKYLEVVLDNFYSFLIGPDGGKKGKENANQVVSEVRQVFFSS